MEGAGMLIGFKRTSWSLVGSGNSIHELPSNVRRCAKPSNAFGSAPILQRKEPQTLFKSARYLQRVRDEGLPRCESDGPARRCSR